MLNDICLLVCDVVKTTVAGAASWSYAGVDSHYEICRWRPTEEVAFVLGCHVWSSRCSFQ